MGIYLRFIITPNMMAKLNLVWITQKNEAVNTSVSSYAPKTKHYSGTDSLKIRVDIGAGCQVADYTSFW